MHGTCSQEARHRVGLTVHADCLFAIQATNGLSASKACSVLTDLTGKDFVLLSQHISIDIIHVSAHQGDVGNESQTFWQTWPARVLHLILLPSGLTGAWISICLFLTIWLRRNFGLLLSILVIPCAPVPVCLQPGSLSPTVTADVLTMHPVQVPDSDPSFLLAGSSFRFVSKAKWLIWLSRIQM